jgi:hypothetical protein
LLLLFSYCYFLLDKCPAGDKIAAWPDKWPAADEMVATRPVNGCFAAGERASRGETILSTLSILSFLSLRSEAKQLLYLLLMDWM